MELRDVRYFIVVAEELSFRRAAARLHLSQPSLSQAIRKLERQVGAILLDRSTRHVALTPAGRDFLDHAYRLTDTADRTLAVARDHDGAAATAHAASSVTGLRVNMPSETNDTARCVIAHLMVEAPHLALARDVLPSRDLRAAMIDGRIDVAIGRAHVDDHRFRTDPLRDEPLVAYLPSDHPLAAGATVTLAALAEVPIYVPSADLAPAWFGFIADAFRRAGVVPQLAEAMHGLGPVSFSDAVRHRGVGAIAVESDTVVGDGVVIRPIADEHSVYPWSVLTLAGDERPEVLRFRHAAQAAAAVHGWRAAAWGQRRQRSP